MQYSDEIKNEVREMYLNGLDSVQISKIKNIKTGTITQWLRKWGISRHRGPKSKIGNEHYFDDIDCEKKAYYLGWLMADGNISIYNNQYSLKIHISDRDAYIVEEFLKDIESTNKINYKKTLFKPTNKFHTSCYVSLTSVHMCKKLIDLGIVPNKSGKEIVPDIQKNLIHHFIRGFFDGDGITDTKKVKRSGFVSNKDMLLSIIEKVKYKKDIHLNPHHTTPWVFYFLGGKDFSKHLYTYMYKDATIWIPRRKKNLEMVCIDGTPDEVKVSCPV